jgi:hypothetical protein
LSKRKYSPAIYYSDGDVSLFDEDAAWSMVERRLESEVQEVLRSMNQSMPGVTCSFTYFGTKYSFSTGHYEDTAQFSLNFLHLGAPKYWWTITKEGSKALERYVFRVKSVAMKYILIYLNSFTELWLKRSKTILASSKVTKRLAVTFISTSCTSCGRNSWMTRTSSTGR